MRYSDPLHGFEFGSVYARCLDFSEGDKIVPSAILSKRRLAILKRPYILYMYSMFLESSSCFLNYYIVSRYHVLLSWAISQRVR